MAIERSNDEDVEFEFKQRVADESIFQAIAKETGFALKPKRYLSVRRPERNSRA